MDDPFNLALGDLPRPYQIIFENEVPMEVEDKFDFRNLDEQSSDEESSDEETLLFDTQEGADLLDEYAQATLDYIDGFVNPETGKWDIELEPDQDLRTAYKNHKINLLSHPKLNLIDPQFTTGQTEIPFLTSDNDDLEIMQSIHSKIDFSESPLHTAVPIKDKDLEPIMESIETGDKQGFINTLQSLDYDTDFLDV